MSMLAPSLLLLLATTASAVSVSEVTPLVPKWQGWLLYDQDNFAAQGDDKYTGGARVGFWVHDWLLTASYGLHTDRVGKIDGTRSDEATLVVQKQLKAVRLGFGVLVSGDLHGDRVQETVHTWDGSPKYDQLTYGEDALRPLVVMAYDRPLIEWAEGTQSSLISWRTQALWALDQAHLRTGVFMASGRYLEGYTLYLEPFYALAAGEPLSTAAATSFPASWGQLGVVAGTQGGFITINLTVTTDAAYGTIGLVF